MQQVLLQRLTLSDSSLPQRLVDIARNVLHLDARHGLTIPLMWRLNMRFGATFVLSRLYPAETGDLEAGGYSYCGSGVGCSGECAVVGDFDEVGVAVGVGRVVAQGGGVAAGG